MKKEEKLNACDSCPFDGGDKIISEPEISCKVVEDKPKKTKKHKKALSTSEKIYNFLDKAEKVATALAKSQKKKKKKAKKQLKKDKKVGKIDKKTGAVILKKVKKDKVQKPMKRYKTPKKK